jgi:hypothetical protein
MIRIGTKPESQIKKSMPLALLLFFPATIAKQALAVSRKNKSQLSLTFFDLIEVPSGFEPL